MNDITALMATLKRAAQEELMCREASDTSDAWQDEASPENVLALVEALEKAQQQNGHLREQSAEWERKAIGNFEECSEMATRIAELESYSKTAIEFREAARDENRHLKLELEIAYRRIAELEREKVAHESVAMALRDDMRESRTITVKLPRRKTADDYIDDTFDPSEMADVYNACRLECEVKFKKVLAAAGIQVIEGEGQ
ncbi:hypothetical protein E1B77_20675 [Salmonella enterica subsp. enterica]|nr:hypothetical protein [Salmonella enterica subsp. enterica]